MRGYSVPRVPDCLFFVVIGSSPSLPPQASVSPSLDPTVQGDEHHLAGEGMGGPNSDNRTESLSLFIFCAGGGIVYVYV